MTTINPSTIANTVLPTASEVVESAIENLADGKMEALANPNNTAELLKDSVGRMNAATGGSAEAASGNFESVDQALELFENDEKAFFEKLSQMDSDDRASWMMAVQTELQATNQLVTAITNFQKAQHDTQKAILANIRV